MLALQNYAVAPSRANQELSDSSPPKASQSSTLQVRELCIMLLEARLFTWSHRRLRDTGQQQICFGNGLGES